MATVRTRFAPSPTGYLHVGGVRTALFAWLLARQHNGAFILRLEDTDKKREVEGSAEHLIKSLTALGLSYDEGPDIGGPHGPYRQSERLDIYKKWAQKLLESGRAYADPYTAEEVQGFREAAQKQKKPFLYRHHRPDKPPAWDGSQPLRFKSDPKTQQWHDEVMGNLSAGPEVVDDFILIKSDGFPTYNFSHIVDDAEMRISHIIRGQEFLASVPNYLNLYEALELTPPILATVPHILNAAGNKKLSKRDGAKDVLDYIQDGYLPDALVSFIATLGWNDGTTQEVYTRDELLSSFRLDKIQRSGAHFDEQRLMWVNGHFIRNLPLKTLSQLAKNYWPPSARAAGEDYKQKVLGLLQERLKYLSELSDLSSFFFEKPSDAQMHKLYNEPVDKQLKKVDTQQMHELLKKSIIELEQGDFNPKTIEEKLHRLLAETGSKPGILFPILRIALSGSPASPPIAETLAVLGKQTALERLKHAEKVVAE